MSETLSKNDGHPAGAEISAEQVRDYLAANPDFLIRHPELIAHIEVPHTGGGTSLLEHQAKLLRDRNRDLERQLHEFRDVAAANETRLTRIHDLHLDMLHASSLNGLLDDIIRRLRDDFDCDAVIVLMFGKTEIQHPALRCAGKQAALFGDLRERRAAICGRLGADRLQALFGDAAQSINSAALAPLDDQAELGLLALGSGDEARFHPGKGTLFLTLLGQMLGQAMLPLLAEP